MGFNLTEHSTNQAAKYYALPQSVQLQQNCNARRNLVLQVVMDDFKISKLDRFRFDFLKKI